MSALSGFTESTELFRKLRSAIELNDSNIIFENKNGKPDTDELVLPGSKSSSFWGENSVGAKEVVDLNTKGRKDLFIQFGQLVESRKSYLANLPSLRKDWASYESETPSSKAVNISTDILDALKNFLNANNSFPIPKLVLGPMPIGGILLEVHANETSAIYFTIPNDATKIEVDVKKNDFFIDFEVAPKNIQALLVSEIDTISR